MRAFINELGQLCFEEDNGKVEIVRKTKDSASKYQFVTRHVIEDRDGNSSFVCYTVHKTLKSADSKHTDFGHWTPVSGRNGCAFCKKETSFDKDPGREYKRGGWQVRWGGPQNIWLSRPKSTYQVFKIEE